MKTGEERAVKIFACRRSFEVEQRFYRQAPGTPSEALKGNESLVKCQQIFEGSWDLLGSSPGDLCLPPCIVMERGESLETAMKASWPDRMASFMVCPLRGLLVRWIEYSLLPSMRTICSSQLVLGASDDVTVEFIS